MRIDVNAVMGVLPDALAMRATRSAVLSRNIANADTPNFKAQDIDFKTVLARLGDPNVKPAALHKTNAAHLGLAGQDPDSATYDTLKFREPTMPGLDGNTVDVQMEQSTFAENSMQYLALLRALNGRIQGTMSAIRGE